MSTDPDRSIETLVRLAGERELPSDEAVARARAAAEEAWRRMLASEPARPRSRFPLALAATLALVVVGWYAWSHREPEQPPMIVARVVARRTPWDSSIARRSKTSSESSSVQVVTTAPRLGVKSTSPSASRRRSASRTGVRLTPTAVAISCSVRRAPAR